MNKLFLTATILLMGLTSCDSSFSKLTNTAKPAETVKPVAVEVPIFNQDSAYAFIADQCTFGARVPNTKAHEDCLNYLESKMKSHGATVVLQKVDLKAYNGTMLKSTNVISSFFPERNVRVVLFSHWDSRPFSDHENTTPKDAKPVMGANDGASGVGVLMELARNIAANDPNIGVDIVFLDSEDYGAPKWAESQVEDDWCLGSQHWSKNHGYTSENKPRVGILLDMVGGADANFSIDAISNYYAGAQAYGFWNLAQEMGFSDLFTSQQGGQIIDDHYYVNMNAGIPTFDIIDYRQDRGFPEMWHTQHDDIQHIDRNTLGKVGRVLMRYIYTFATR